MNLDKKSVIVGGVAVVGLAILIYFGIAFYMSGDSGVSRASACAEMRDTMRRGQDALANNPNNRELMKSVTNLQNVYADTCL